MNEEVEDGIPSRVERAATAEEVGEALRHASAEGLAVVPRGLGTKLDWGSIPVDAGMVLDVNGVNQTLDHVPDDMIVTASAGVSMSDLARALADNGQHLAVDVCGYDDGTPEQRGTVGGLLSTGGDGARRWGFGAARDLLLGVELVRADGRIAHSGGRVVKNVAGYDLGKLLTGALGTLGILTQATFRVHPVPEATAYVHFEASTPEDADRRARAVLDSQLTPVAVDINHRAATTAVVAMFEGSAAGVRNRVAAAAGLTGGEIEETAPDWFNTMPLGPADTLLRVSLPPTEIPWLCRAVDDLADAHGIHGGARGSAGTGILHCALPRGTATETVAAFLRDLRRRVGSSHGRTASDGGGGRERSGAGDGGSRPAPADGGGYVTVRHAPAAVRRAVDVWGPVDPGARVLTHSIKRQFDPDGLLSPGRMGEES